MVEFGVHLWDKAIILLRHVGILPKIWFITRSKIRSWVRWHRCEGMHPKKWLDRRKSIIKFGWLLPNHIGISPMQFFNDGGSSLLKLLLLKSNVSIPSKEPTELGIFPWKWLFAKLRIFNPLKWNQQLRSTPDNWLLERSKKFKFPLVTAHRDWTCFENILLERSKCTAQKKILVFRLLVYHREKGELPWQIWNMTTDLVVR